MRLILRDVRWHSDGQDHQGDLRIAAGKVVETGQLKPHRGEKVLSARGYLALPGLINAHDHLSLNLLPRLGEPPYPNVYAWARDIYHPDEPPIQPIETIALRDRLHFGALRQLISGVTTVAHHDPFYRRHLTWGYPLRVLYPYGWSHSLGFGDNVRRAFDDSRGRLFFIHAAEGVDDRAASEIRRLATLGILSDRTVLIHAIAMDSVDRDHLIRTQTGVVWCPASNHWLYGESAPVEELWGQIPLALGTDSTLSGSPTLFDELRAASSTGRLEATQLLSLVTTEAARLLQLHDGRGRLEIGGPADLILLRDHGDSAAETVLKATPDQLGLVLIAGRPHLASATLAKPLKLPSPQVQVDGVHFWLAGHPQRLLGRILQQADASTLGLNPLWPRISPVESLSG